MCKFQSFLEKFCGYTSTEVDVWKIGCFFLFFKEGSRFFTTIDNFTFSKSFHEVHINWNFHFQDIDIETRI